MRYVYAMLLQAINFFFDGDFDKSLIHLKKAETNLKYCDSMSSFVYAYIVKNTITTDTILALNYAYKALEKNLEYNNLRRLPYSYMDMSLLTKGDQARYYLEKSLEYFDDWGDEIAKCKYAGQHIDELHPDTIIAMQTDYPKLTNTDLAIIWLTFMNCDRDTICKLLNISSKYYYNRRSIIQKELDIQLDNSKETPKRIEQLIKKYSGDKK